MKVLSATITSNPTHSCKMCKNTNTAKTRNLPLQKSRADTKTTCHIDQQCVYCTTRPRACTSLSRVFKACAQLHILTNNLHNMCVPVCFYLYRRPLAHLPLNTSGPQRSRQWGIWPAGSLSPSLSILRLQPRGGTHTLQWALDFHYDLKSTEINICGHQPESVKKQLRSHSGEYGNERHLGTWKNQNPEHIRFGKDWHFFW